MNSLVLYGITILIWGSTWFAIEFQLGVVAPEVSVVYRYALASLLLFVWSAYKKLKLAYGLREHAWFALLGLLLFGLNYVLAYRAQVFITSALTAIAFTAIVWMNIFFARLFFGVRAGRRVLFGASLGIVGILVLFVPQAGDVSLSNSVFTGLALAVGGAAVASLGNMTSQAAQKRKLPIIQSNAWGMFYGAALTALIAVVQGHAFNFDPSPSYVVSLLYLSVFGSIIAFGAYLTLLGRIGAHKAAYVMVMFPVVALILSMLFEGLVLTWSVVVGTVLVLAGNLFVMDSQTKPRTNEASQGQMPIGERLPD